MFDSEEIYSKTSKKGVKEQNQRNFPSKFKITIQEQSNQVKVIKTENSESIAGRE